MHGLLSEVQAVPTVTSTSPGQAALVPSQLSATSHSPAEARHRVPADFFASTGQALLLPVQVSATSQVPATARQLVPADFFASAGQVVEVPVQVSAASQTSAAARQVVPALPAACWQLTELPLQRSVVQAFPSSVQAVPLAFFPSAGQVAEVPVQVSAASQSSVDARQTVATDLKEQVPTVPARLQAWHSPPLQAVLQQTPETQNPLEHWRSEVQTAPFACVTPGMRTWLPSGEPDCPP